MCDVINKTKKMFCKIVYRATSQNDKIRAIELIKTLCKTYESYKYVELNGSNVLIIYDTNRTFKQITHYFSSKSSLYKTKNKITLENKFIYEDISENLSKHLFSIRNFNLVCEENFENDIMEYSEEQQYVTTINNNSTVYVDTTSNTNTNNDSNVLHGNNMVEIENENVLLVDETELIELFEQLKKIKSNNFEKYYRTINIFNQILYY